MADWEAIADGVMKGGNLFYNLFTNKRDFDYQKALQQQIFEREDTAVQRRMADLQAAGLNPNLAAGSAANAGSVVARSNTNDLNPGSFLDTAAALAQLKNVKEQGEILKQQKYEQKMKNNMMMANMLYQLGFDPKVSWDGNGNVRFFADTKSSSFVDSPLGRQFVYQLQNDANNAAMIQKNNDWYTADKIESYGMDILNMIQSFMPKSVISNVTSQSTGSRTNYNYNQSTNQNHNYNYWR